MKTINSFLKQYEHLYFSPSEQKVFEYLQNSKQISNAKTIAYKCDVNPSAISSLIKKMGYANYISFSLYLNEYLNSSLNVYNLNSYKEKKSDIDNIYKKIDIKLLNNITTEIIRLNKVIFFDSNSQYPFQDLSLRLQRLDIQIIYIENKEELAYIVDIDEYYFLSLETFYEIGKYINYFEQIIICDLVYNNVYNIYSYKNDKTILRLMDSEKQ